MRRLPLVTLSSVLLLSIGSAALFYLPARQKDQAEAQSLPEIIPASQILGEPLRPVPSDLKFDPDRVELGKKLFHDKKLSADNTISCASCHSLDKGGTDQSAHSIGIKGEVGGINSPSVFNSGLNYKQFWNGRAETLEDQVNGPTHHPKEMGSNWQEIVGKLQQDADYPALFARLYPDGIQPQNIRDAIATFERSLTTPNAPFDRYLRGEVGAISDEAKAGYRLFKNYGCASCHQGVNIGGNMFQKFGVMGDYFAERGKPTDADLGRFEVTKREQDRGVFRVPSLRNIALTKPYFHDGSTEQLPQAIEIMAKYQLGRYLTAEEVKQIRAFLVSLTGEYGGKSL